MSALIFNHSFPTSILKNSYDFKNSLFLKNSEHHNFLSPYLILFRLKFFVFFLWKFLINNTHFVNNYLEIYTFYYFYSLYCIGLYKRQEIRKQNKIFTKIRKYCNMFDRAKMCVVFDNFMSGNPQRMRTHCQML